MPGKYVYEHPEGKGLGQHHADDDLASRSAHPPEAVAAMRQMAAMIRATPEQVAEIDRMASATMADLDLAHGTVVEHLATDDDGTRRIRWTDSFGTDRVTSISADLAVSHFKPVTEA